ncbi:unnamed protein product [Closterium sp. Naga37s-1]|nr:unnamed protein product [Closterium sp. Naga37s-1]
MKVLLFVAIITVLAIPTLALDSSFSSETTLARRGQQDNYIRPPHQFTDRPVIGVLTLPITVPSQRKIGVSSFATSYQRWIEAGGARVVPIFYDSTKEELDFILNRINGVFWTGGLVDFNPTEEDPEGSKYLATTEYVWKHAVKENSNGNYYPLWGTCLGFERMFQLFANDVNGTLIREVDAENFAINLGFTADGWLSRLFGGMSYELFKQVASPLGDLAFNNHGLGVHPDDFRASPAHEVFRILSVDEDRNGTQFVSTVEGRHFPFYGSQWHPEKAPWEWNPKHEIAHNEWAGTFSNYLGRYFVTECKYNKNQFESEYELSKYLVENWPARPTGKFHKIFSAYSQITFFPSHKPMWVQRVEALEAEGVTAEGGTVGEEQAAEIMVGVDM